MSIMKDKDKIVGPIEPGTIIPFNDKEKLIDKTFVDKVLDCETLVEGLGGVMRAANEDYWKNLRALHPYLDDWEFIADHKKGFIQVTRKKIHF